MSYYQEDNDLQDVIRRFERTLKTKNTGYFDVHEYERIIEHYLDMDDYHLAGTAVNAAIKQHPSATVLLIKKALVLAESGKPGDGLNYIYKIEKLEQSNPDLFLLKGSILTQMGKITRAEHAFQNALNVSFENKHELLLDIALTYQAVSQYKMSLRYLNEAGKIRPGTARIIFEQAYCHERLNSYTRARDHYKKFLDIKPFSAKGWYHLGMLYYKMEEYPNAIDSFDFSLAVNDGNSSALLNKAGALVNLEEYQKAIEVYRELLDQDDQNPMIHTYIGECHEKLGQYDQAIEVYERAIQIDPGFQEAWYGTGVCKLYQRKLQDSLYYLSKAIQFDADNPDYWFTLGNVHASLGAFNEAVKAYTRVEELDPYDAEAWTNHAEAVFKHRGPVKAIEVLKASYSYIADVAAINYHLSAYCFLAGDREHCLSFFENGLKLNPSGHRQAFRICKELKTEPSIQSLLKESLK